MVASLLEETSHSPTQQKGSSAIISTNDACNLYILLSRISQMLDLALLSDSSYLAVDLTFLAARGQIMEHFF